MNPKKENLAQLETEKRHPQSYCLDEMSSLAILTLMNQEDHCIPATITPYLPILAQAVDNIVQVLAKGGRLIYIGAGSSGRLGVLDASECPPTFGVDPSQVQGIIAGGKEALIFAQEGAEDDREQGQKDLHAIQFSSQDILVAITASGRTPYVLGGVAYAKSQGAKTIAITSQSQSPLAEHCDYAITPAVGAEILTGSSRLKSGTMQKMVLNMLSTASFIQLGKCYQNWMVDVKISNQKLFNRAVRIIQEATQLSFDDAEAYLKEADNNPKLAILMVLSGKNKQEAQALLAQHHGKLKQALQDG